MAILKEVKIGRLMLAIAITVFVADTAPHPQLSDGLLENTWERFGATSCPHLQAAAVEG
ncbi:MAG: hypothetical protein ACFBSG_00970 [Leptolyngbyaceae cyanobacterium]